MKKNLILSFLSMVVVQVLIRLQGVRLVTPQSTRGIIDLELARTPDRLFQLRLFWNNNDVNQNILIDYLFIAAALWFLLTLARWMEEIKDRKNLGRLIRILALSVCISDCLENFLMLMIWHDRLEASTIGSVFYCSVIKFIFTGILLLVVLYSLPILFIRKKTSTVKNADNYP